MLRDDVWAATGMASTVSCASPAVKRRPGRRLGPGDFTDDRTLYPALHSAYSAASTPSALSSASGMKCEYVA